MLKRRKCPRRSRIHRHPSGSLSCVDCCWTIASDYARSSQLARLKPAAFQQSTSYAAPNACFSTSVIFAKQSARRSIENNKAVLLLRSAASQDNLSSRSIAQPPPAPRPPLLQSSTKREARLLDLPNFARSNGPNSRRHFGGTRRSFLKNPDAANTGIFARPSMGRVSFAQYQPDPKSLT
jgi:hypothetical protein